MLDSQIRCAGCGSLNMAWRRFQEIFIFATMPGSYSVSWPVTIVRILPQELLLPWLNIRLLSIH